MNERIRVDMRFPKDLVQWVKKHAKKRRTTVTQIFIDAIVAFQERNEDANSTR
jgi:hypothetical protein